MEGYHCDAEHVYAVTLSSELSGSYNSAVLGKNLYEDLCVQLKICISRTDAHRDEDCAV